MALFKTINFFIITANKICASNIVLSYIEFFKSLLNFHNLVVYFTTYTKSEYFTYRVHGRHPFSDQRDEHSQADVPHVEYQERHGEEKWNDEHGDQGENLKEKIGFRIGLKILLFMPMR